MILALLSLLLALGLGFTLGAMAGEDVEAALYDSMEADPIIRIGLALGLPWIIVLALVVYPRGTWSAIQAHGTVILWGVRK